MGSYDEPPGGHATGSVPRVPHYPTPGRTIKSKFPSARQVQTSGPEADARQRPSHLPDSHDPALIATNQRKSHTYTDGACLSRAPSLRKQKTKPPHGYQWLHIESCIIITGHRYQYSYRPPSGIAFIGSVTWRPHVGFGFITITRC